MVMGEGKNHNLKEHHHNHHHNHNHNHYDHDQFDDVMKESDEHKQQHQQQPCSSIEDSSTISSLSCSSCSSFEDTMDDASSSSANSSRSSLYDLTDLMTHLPIKRGLSKFYNGKSDSFTSLARVTSIEDLPKKKNKKKIKKTYKSHTLPKPLISKKNSRKKKFGSSIKEL